MKQCEDNAADRKIGAEWENRFCARALGFNRIYTRHQEGKRGAAKATSPSGKIVTLPDVTLWSWHSEHHEIKHKTTNEHGAYGLELYRYESLIQFGKAVGGGVYYTIHDHRGSRRSTLDRPEDWLTACVFSLPKPEPLSVGCRVFPGWTWRDGRKARAQICYWPASLWVPLERFWREGPAVFEAQGGAA